MTEFKSERRQRQRDKARRGMQVTNTSIRLLAKLSIEPKAIDRHEKMESHNSTKELKP